MLENKKNVLFDMDGLLIDSEALGIKMWEKVFAQHNEPFNPEAAYKTIGSNGLASQEMLYQSAPKYCSTFSGYLLCALAMLL